MLDFQETDKIHSFITQRIKTIDRLQKSVDSIAWKVVPEVLANLKIVCEIMNELYTEHLVSDWTVESLYVSFYEEDAILMQWCQGFYCWVCKDYIDVSLMSCSGENEVVTDFKREIQPPEPNPTREALLHCINTVNSILNKK